MNDDDDDILAQLVTRLDIDVAVSSLRKLGFYGIKFNGYYHMYRIHPRDSASIEELDIAITSQQDHLKITWNKKESEFVHTWHQWLEFTRSVTPSSKTRSIQIGSV